MIRQFCHGMIRILAVLLLISWCAVGCVESSPIMRTAEGYAQNSQDSKYVNMTEDLSWTNSISSWEASSKLGKVAVFLCQSAYLHQAQVCWRHWGYTLDGLGLLFPGIHYSYISGKYVAYFVAWHTPRGFIISSIANRDDLVRPDNADSALTYWIIANSIENATTLARLNLDYLQPIQFTSTPLPPAYMRYFEWDDDEIRLFMESAEFRSAIDIRLVEWFGDNATQRTLKVPLVKEIKIKTDADKLVAYIGSPADKIYAERGYP